METALSYNAAPSHRKLIDIPDDVFKTLSMKAALVGMNLKKFIESLLVAEAEEMDDAEVYRYLVSTRPDGLEILEGKEKEDFEAWLNSKRQ